MSRILSQKFFDRPTHIVGKELLGKFLVRRVGKKTISDMITEVEIYRGPNDKASHASRGKTERTKVMFGPPGYWYVYLIYGMHCCLNIVTEKEGYPAAVLIRGIDNIRGPGKICRYFHIGKQFNTKKASYNSELWIEDGGVTIPDKNIQRGRRIGVDYAGAWKNKLWRFSIN